MGTLPFNEVAGEPLNTEQAAYREGLSGGGDALDGALRRNLYRNATPENAAVARLAAYVRAQTAVLAVLGDADLLAGRVAFTGPEWMQKGDGQ